MSSHRLYSFIFQTFLKHIDAENAHHLGALIVKTVGLPVIRNLKHSFTKPDQRLHRQTMGLHFDSPFGMAAGFDKDATMVAGLYAMGFGHVEVGTITAQAQPGNPKPRLFRLVSDRALINRMGFNNHGAEAAVRKLTKLRKHKHRPVIGVNIGKSRVVDVENATADYLASATLLAPLADYLVVNVSSPNTPGLRGLQELEQLTPLLTAVNEAAGATPLLVKIAPDLSNEEITAISTMARKIGLAGIIATNTTISRDDLKAQTSRIEEIGAGGLSGAPLKNKSLQVLKLIRKSVPEENFCIISVGGVETATDVAERLQAGATLVQGYTGFIYNGPFWAYTINRQLKKLLD